MCLICEIDCECDCCLYNQDMCRYCKNLGEKNE